MKLLKISFLITGIAGIFSALIITPEFASRYISSDSIITPEGFEAISQLRLFSLIIGSVLLLAGLLFYRFPEDMKAFIKRPTGTTFLLICIWIFLAFINLLLKKMGIATGTPDLFPLSEFYGPRIRSAGLPYSVIFLAVLFISLKFIKHFDVLHVWIIGLILIFLGNLAQGGVEDAFYKPINAPFIYLDRFFYEQYYHDAIKITDWHQWLSNFNANQKHLFLHTRTHPPFAVLLHYLFLKISNNSLPFLAGSFILLSSLTIIIVFMIMKALGLSKQQASLFALLFSVVPSYNIYSSVSLDGVIVTFSALFLLGIIMLIKNRVNLVGIVLVAAGILLTNMLTFIGLFLVGTAGLIGLRELSIDKKSNILAVLFIAMLIMLTAYSCMLYFYGYNHIQAFSAVTAFEPKSLLSPISYVMTRLENLTMFLMFLSFGISAVFISPDYLKLRIFDLRDNINSISFAGFIPLISFLLIGGLYTGEISRIFLFLYPFFFLLLRNLEEATLRFLIIAAGVQTIVMQTVGGYFW
ncbi:hypothetical protein C4544_04745 [candidate division WS5 bacterium]|uniref:Glycosyltransferase RgtA/B/C/D-like domain-containing protein n=1 Tax=candidate division WS5 bacterium TaxID=2093353 RepID=A0A419DBU9_9BACT|nr:MAG: hypothetical protein C4544_04745 [candidate division WS5 bacterium]